MWNGMNGMKWNRERQRRGMAESRAAASRNGGMAGGSVAEWNNIPKNYYI
jgi:hypothetical protein